ncbi:hypothetical protein [uncultured Duncaniella sp.]|uniref:hypothetical protein n=2 Tax=Muribaculaceae TaxID=2005473 RepID=UPI00321F611D
MRRSIKLIESQIIELVGSDIDEFNYDNLSKEQKEEVKLLLQERRDILNELFQPTEANLAQFCKLNDELYRLTMALNERVKRIVSKKDILLDSNDFDDDYELEGTLKFVFNDETSISRLPDDDYYGSNFAVMIKTLYEVYVDYGIESIVTINEHHGPLDDGVSWYEYPFNRFPEFKDFIICYAVHDLTDHKLYSIPDLLRLNDFWSEVEFKVQSITNQDGQHYDFQ